MAKQRFIPDNVLQGKRILGFRVRNLAEGGIESFIMFLIISSIPFVPKVRWILVICLTLFILLMNGIGIRGQSYTQALLNYFQYRKYLKQYSYRRLSDGDHEQENIFAEAGGEVRVTSIKQGGALSIAKKLIGR